MADMKCTVVVAWLDAKKKKTTYVGGKYLVANGTLAIEQRTLDANGELIKVQSTGIPLALIAGYEATYEKVDKSESSEE